MAKERHRATLPLAFLLPGALIALVLTTGALAQDAERATHGDEAVTPQLSFEERVGDFVIRQYQLGCLSQLTYLIGSGGEAVVVDPQRDVAHYLRDAEQLGLQIRYVLLTHTNADFVAGHTELAQRVGAKVLISGQSGSAFEHQALHDKDTLKLGDATLEFWATPGHTLDAMTTLVHVQGAGADPAYALTGDTLFIGGIGRPDLMGGDVTPVVLAQHAFNSMQRLMTLPDATKVLPAHGAGSLCGAHLSPETVSTMGDQRATNPYLTTKSRAAFVSRVIAGLPVAPAYFRFNVALNRKGPPVVDWTEQLPVALTPEATKRAIEDGAWVVDLRDAAEYAAGHIPAAVNIAVRGRLDTWTGIAVPFDGRMILVGSDEEVREAAFRFRRIGLDGVAGYLVGGVDAWRATGAAVRTTELVAPLELASRIAKGSEPILVDVRTPDEYAELRIGDYANIPVIEWASFSQILDKSQPVLFVCNSAYRSSMAVGLAERQGFEKVANLAGGLDAWLAASLPVIGSAPICTAPSPVADVRAMLGITSGTALMALPEVIEPSALARALMDQPQLYVVLDVRPKWQFDEYHVPGAVHVAPEDVVEILRAQAPAVRTVLVDRDGTIAFAVAGTALSALGTDKHALHALVGGTSAYWQQIELARLTDAPDAVPAGSTGAAASMPKTPPTPPTPEPTSKARRKAGC
ncbi:MAG: MBL fold metallo-hydrolase [Planctomycetes bacterium]|nr:MBL fold metallo-hydrolase [Planctomycetota bacterium]